MALPEIYVSTDIETDGRRPGINSMLSIGSAAYLRDKTLVSTFSANLELLDGAQPDPNTIAWWQKFPEAWAACRQDCRAPAEVMRAYHAWLKALPGRPILVGYPVSFDYPFVSYYLERFVGDNPFHLAAIDVRSFAMGLLGCNHKATTKRHLPKHVLPQKRHTHIALDDAIEQGELFCNLLAYGRAE